MYTARYLQRTSGPGCRRGGRGPGQVRTIRNESTISDREYTARRPPLHCLYEHYKNRKKKKQKKRFEDLKKSSPYI